MNSSDPKPSRRKRNIVVVVVGSIISIILVTLLFTQLNITLDTILSQLSAVSWWEITIIVILTLLMFFLSAYQWQITLIASQTRSETPKSVPEIVTLYFYTTLGAVLGTIVPIQISTPFIRSIMLRVRDNTTIVRGGTTSIIEQGSALLIPVLLSFPSILALQSILSFEQWLIITVICLVFSWIFMVFLLPYAAKRLVSRFARETETSEVKKRHWFHVILEKLRLILDTDLFSFAVLQKLFLLTLLRYFIITIRIMAIMMVLQLQVPLIAAIYIVPVMQITQLFNLTPGNLGMREWTWVGLLSLIGIDAAVSGAFALAQRIVIFLSVMAAGVIVSILFFVLNQSRPISSFIKEEKLS